MNSESKIQSSSSGEAWAVAILFAVLSVGTIMLGLMSWMPPLASRHGAGIDQMLVFTLISTGTMLLIGNALLVMFILKASQRARVGARMAAPGTERKISIIFGLLMTVVAEGGVLAIGIPAFQQYYFNEPPADSLTVEITGEQFAWNIRYPGPDGEFGRTDPTLIGELNPLGIDPADPKGKDDVVGMNNLYVVVDEPVRLILRSKDVIHSLFLPFFRVKQDAVPGMTIPVWFVPTKTGQYEIACTELCGLAHYRMRGMLHVVSSDELENWLQENAPSEDEVDEFWG